MPKRLDHPPLTTDEGQPSIFNLDERLVEELDRIFDLLLNSLRYQDFVNKVRNDEPQTNEGATSQYLNQLLGLGFNAEQLKQIFEELKIDGGLSERDRELLSDLFPKATQETPTGDDPSATQQERIARIEEDSGELYPAL